MAHPFHQEGAMHVDWLQIIPPNFLLQLFEDPAKLPSIEGVIFFHSPKTDIISGMVYYFGIAVHCKRSEFSAILGREGEDTFEEERVDP